MNFELSFVPETFFGQLAFILGSLFLLLSGAAIFYTIADWWLRGLRIPAEILGVRRRGPQFFSVFRYTLPDGTIHEATSIQGGGSPDHRETGKRVIIRYRPTQPTEVREAPGTAMWVLAFALFASGAWLTWDSITIWKHHLVTWLVIALVATYAGRKIWQRVRPLLTKLKAEMGSDPWHGVPIEPAESFAGIPQAGRLRFTTSTSSSRSMQSSPQKPGRVGAAFCIAGVVVLGVASIPIRHLVALKHGTRAAGTVYDLHANLTDRNHHSVFPEVQFTDTHGTTVRFMDGTGSNPSPYTIGDHVTVLYQPAKTGTAMIDRGLRNWEPVLALLVLGATLTALGLFTLRATLQPAFQAND